MAFEASLCAACPFRDGAAGLPISQLIVHRCSFLSGLHNVVTSKAAQPTVDFGQVLVIWWSVTVHSFGLGPMARLGSKVSVSMHYTF